MIPSPQHSIGDQTMIKTDTHLPTRTTNIQPPSLLTSTPTVSSGTNRVFIPILTAQTTKSSKLTSPLKACGKEETSQHLSITHGLESQTVLHSTESTTLSLTSLSVVPLDISQKVWAESHGQTPPQDQLTSSGTPEVHGKTHGTVKTPLSRSIQLKSGSSTLQPRQKKK